MIDVAVYDRIKTLADGRVYFLQIPEKSVLPAIAYTVISSAEEYSGDGHDGMSQYRIQIDVWSDNRAEGRALMAQIKTAMRMSADDFATVDESDNIDELEPATEQHRASTDFICWQKS